MYYSYTSDNPSSRLFGDGAKPLSFPIISAFLRLGHKYEIFELQQSAESRLKACFPENLDDFQNTSRPSTKDGDLNFDPQLIRMNLEEVPAVINLARAHNLASLLPSAFLLSSFIATETLINGSRDQDGNRLLLSKEGMIRCIHGHDIQKETEIIEILEMVHLVAESCQLGDRCNIRIMFSDVQSRQTMVTSAGLRLPPASWLECWFRYGEQVVCQACQAGMKTKWDNFRATTWSDLREIFSLEDNMDNSL